MPGSYCWLAEINNVQLSHVFLRVPIWSINYETPLSTPEEFETRALFLRLALSAT